MRRVLLTGMSGTGKSSVIGALAARGYKAVDTDDGWCEALPDGRQRWREEAIEQLLAIEGVDALTPVADFFARRDFTVASRTRVADLQLRADDGPFATGIGPLVTGSTLALVMSMAGRVSYLAELDGPGAPTLRSRFQATAA